MKYINYATYTTDTAKISAHRPAHREFLAGLLRQGKLAASGPFMDDSGGLFIYEAESPEAAAAIVAQDPFSTNGVFAKCELRPWKLVFSNADLLETGS